MKRRVRVHSLRTHRFSKYLKPGALARLRDSKILTHRVTFLTRSLPQPPPLPTTTTPQQDSPSPHEIELMPEFLSLDRGPHCVGRKKLVAAKSAFITSVNPEHISVVNTNLLVH